MQGETDSAIRLTSLVPNGHDLGTRFPEINCFVEEDHENLGCKIAVTATFRARDGFRWQV